MLGRISRSHWLLAAALLGSALLGAGLFALLQLLLPAQLGDRAKIERIVRAYILDHPEILPEAMDRLQARETAAVLAGMPDVRKPYAGAWTGNEAGDVTVVAFLDYNCGYCRSNIPAITRLVERDPKVRVVYREYPVLGEESILAARWALAAAEQGKFKAFHEALYAGGRATGETIAAAAARAGLDTARAGQAIASRAVEGELAGNYRYGRDLRIAGTPGWVIGKRVYQAAMSYDELVAAVAEARAGR